MADDCIHQFKTCTKCGEAKPDTPEHFGAYKDKGKIRNYTFCRACLNARTRSYRSDNPEKTKEWDRQNTIKNKAPGSDYQKRRYERKDKTEARESVNAWKAQNPDKVRKHWERTYEKHKAKHLERRKIWAKENPLARIAITDRRRARELGASGYYTKDDVRELLRVHGRVCFYCSTALTRFHVDHFIPLARGGTNGPENLRLSCPKCNYSKAARMPWEWKPEKFSNPICEAV